jgi:hypothetical protein
MVSNCAMDDMEEHLIRFLLGQAKGLVARMKMADTLEHRKKIQISYDRKGKEDWSELASRAPESFKMCLFRCADLFTYKPGPVKRQLELYYLHLDLTESLCYGINVDDFFDVLRDKQIIPVPSLKRDGTVTGIRYIKGIISVTGKDVMGDFSWPRLLKRGLDYKEERDHEYFLTMLENGMALLKGKPLSSLNMELLRRRNGMVFQ